MWILKKYTHESSKTMVTRQGHVSDLLFLSLGYSKKLMQCQIGNWSYVEVDNLCYVKVEKDVTSNDTTSKLINWRPCGLRGLSTSSKDQTKLHNYHRALGVDNKALLTSHSSTRASQDDTLDWFRSYACLEYRLGAFYGWLNELSFVLWWLSWEGASHVYNVCDILNSSETENKR